MKIKPLLWIQGVLYALFGVMFLILPEMAMDMFVGGLGVTPSFYVLTRMVGGTALGLSILLLGATRVENTYTKRLFAVALVVLLALEAVLHAYGVMIDAIRPFGWSLVALFGVLMLLFASTFLRSDP